MFLFRVMNDFDILINPLENGIVSKKMIYDITRRHLYNIDREKIENMSKLDRDSYVKKYMYEYLINHKHKLDKIFRKEHIKTRNNIHSFVIDKDNFSYCKIIKDLSTLPNHLINGSRTITNWISMTSSLDGIWNYYDKQNVHGVIVLDVNTNGVFNEDTYIVDISNRDTIYNIKFLSNKIKEDDFSLFIKFMEENPMFQDGLVNTFNKYVMRPTDKHFMGFNFSAASSEYCAYNYLQKENVVSVLEALQIDLICAELFNLEYLLLNKRQQKQELIKLKEMILKHILEEKNGYMLYVFEELYLKNHNMYKITNNELELEKMKLMRNEIITKSQFLSNVLIKRRTL